MPTPKYWHVTMKRGRKPHLTLFTSHQLGSGSMALCGHPLPQNARKGSAKTINIPVGNECEKCLISGGYLKKPKPTVMDRHLKNLINAGKMLHDYGLSGPEIADVFRKINQRAS